MTAAQSLQVVEILRRVDQGVTRPFLVRADDGNLYAAKGRNLPPYQRMAEWLAAWLARSFGLPIPDFGLLDVPAELVDLYGAEARDLGAGLVFGSRWEMSAREFSVSDLKAVPGETAMKVFAFDWWVRNADRSLTELGGNPNLLWLPADKRMVAIDHNLAFDPDFDAESFLSVHVFRHAAPEVFDDLVNRDEIALQLQSALANFDDAVAAMPRSWRFLDVEETIPAGVELLALKRHLAERLPLSRG